MAQMKDAEDLNTGSGDRNEDRIKEMIFMLQTHNLQDVVETREKLRITPGF